MHDEHEHEHEHEHETGHHEHAHGHAHAPHPYQPDHPEPSTWHELLGVALNEILIEKNIYSADEIRAKIETLEGIGVESHGAKVIARAWADPAFKASLLRDARAAVEALGMDGGYTGLMAFENTPEEHNVIVCTLCSCYPRYLLGRPPAWYKSKPYRARVVREPRAVLAEFGTVIPDDVTIRVHDSNAEMRYFVIPQRPAGTEGWSEEKLAALVTRDSMLGVAQARPVVPVTAS